MVSLIASQPINRAAKIENIFKPAKVYLALCLDWRVFFLRNFF
jgi:hypothetical protein